MSKCGKNDVSQTKIPNSNIKSEGQPPTPTPNPTPNPNSNPNSIHTLGEKAAKMKHGDEHDMLTWLYTLDYQKVTVTIAAHMSRYHSELSVQEAGCEAWQEYAATATDLRPVLTSGGCGAVVKALEKFKAKRRLVWKVTP